MTELTMEQMADKFAAEHAAPLTREVLAELLSDYVDNEYVLDPIIMWLLENGPADMNRLAVVDFPQESRERFAMLIGYSVSGAGDLSYFSDAMYNRAWAECERMIAEKEAS